MGFSHTDFIRLFPTDDACRAFLKERTYPDGSRCPGCQRASRFHPIRGRSAYSCQYCGRHVYPTSGTIFHRSRTSLQLWFWAVFLIGSTRGSISARELERELRVTPRTAERMRRQILDRRLGPSSDGGELEVRLSPSGFEDELEGRLSPSGAEDEPARAEPPSRIWQGRRRRSGGGG